MLHRSIALAAILTLVATAQPALAAEAKAVAPRPATVLPLEDFHFEGNVGRTVRDSDPPEFPQPPRPPKGAPNIVYILIDDAGYGQFGTFGGQVETPALDRIAAAGQR
jgi:hypothetical protein